MEPTQTDILLQFFKAVAQPDRLKILGLLANQPHAVTELATKLHLKQKVVTRHLRALQNAQLITRDAVSGEPSYRLNPTRLEALNQMIARMSPATSLKERTLKKYVINGRLQAIPRKPEEKAVILEWIANKFELDKRYTETEINELVKTFYDKPLTLRRILADNRFLLHTGRQYWRPIPGRTY